MQLHYFEEVSGGKATLLEEEAKHCIRVLRHKEGDTIHGVDGRGNYYSGKIIDYNKHRVQVVIEEKIQHWGEPEYKLSAAVSLLRLEGRFEWFAEKAVELGVTTIIPIVTERSLKTKLKVQRLTKIMISAMKQCKRSVIPTLTPVTRLKDFLTENDYSLKLIGWCEEATPIHTFEKPMIQNDNICFLVGPEGDFTKNEVELALESGFQTVSMGETRLRAETAAIHLMSLIKYLKDRD